MKKHVLLFAALFSLSPVAAFAHHHAGDVTIGRDAYGNKVTENVYTGKTHIHARDPYTGEKIRINPETGTVKFKDPYTGHSIKENPMRGTVTYSDKWDGMKVSRTYHYRRPVYSYDHYRNVYGGRYREGYYDGMSVGLVAGMGLVANNRVILPESDWYEIRARYYDNYRVELLPEMVIFYPEEDGCSESVWVRTPDGNEEYIGSYAVSC